MSLQDDFDKDFKNFDREFEESHRQFRQEFQRTRRTVTVFAICWGVVVVAVLGIVIYVGIRVLNHFHLLSP